MTIYVESNTKQAAWVALGSLFSFGFGIVSSMILSRYFTKGDYGTYKQVIYVYSTLLGVFTLGLPKAFSYFLPRVNINQAKSLISKITKLFFILGAILSVLLFVFSSQIASFLNNEDLAFALRIFSVVPFLMLPTMGLEGILATYKKTKFLTIYTIATRTAMLLCVALPVIIFNFGYIEAIIGFVIASVLTFILALYLKYYPVKDAGNDSCDISYKNIFKFSLPLFNASIFGIIITSADQFFISRYFGKEIFANFSNGWMELPFIGMITGACATVLSPIFSKMNYDKVDPLKEIYPIWMNVFEKSILLIYPILLYCCCFSDVIMTVLYGGLYSESGSFFLIKSSIYFFSIISYAPLIINIGKVKYYSNVHMYGALLLVLLEYISVKIFCSAHLIAIISVLCQLGRIVCMLALVSKFFKIRLYQLFPVKILMKVVPFSLLLLLCIRFFTTEHIENNLVILIISFSLYVIVFLLYSFKTGLNYLSIVKPIIKK